MPTLWVKKKLLFEALGQEYTDDEFRTICFDFGIELDDVSTESSLLQKEAGSEGAKHEGPDEVMYKIDIPANRYDLLCLEGLSTALLVFLNKMKCPLFKAVLPSDPKNLQKLIIDPSTKVIRPFALAAVLRDITFNQNSYNSFIELQDKLHQNLARKRTLVAIGTHDLDTIQGPFTYMAQPPEEIKFVPLNKTEEYNAKQLMDLYSTHAQLKQYLHIIKDSPVYPVIRDANGAVLSMPPIINGNQSKITLNTKNVFIEVTATDLNKAHIILDTLVTTFSQYCKTKYVTELCEVITIGDNKRIEKSPKLSYRKEVINSKKVNKYIGIDLEASKMASLLDRMGLSAKAPGGAEIVVQIPPTRHDILHPVDIYEDVAIAFGYNEIVKTIPDTNTVGKQYPINKLSDQLRREIAQAGFSETLTFSLVSQDDISKKIRKELGPAVSVSNPKTIEFQVVRTTLIPGVLKTIASNKSMPLPLKIFEVSDIVVCDENNEVGARNERRLCAAYYDKVAGFEKIHGLLDRVMLLLEVPWTKEGGYFLRPCEDSMFFPKRSAEIVRDGEVIGKIGVLHPEVLAAFELSLPCSIMEINIEVFL